MTEPRLSPAPARDLSAFFRQVREYCRQVRAGLDPEAQAAHDAAEQRWEAAVGGEPSPLPPFFVHVGANLVYDPDWRPDTAAADDLAKRITEAEPGQLPDLWAEARQLWLDQRIDHEQYLNLTEAAGG